MKMLSSSSDEDALRVCADPNNMPFSNARAEGFEDRLAELVARDLGKKRVKYEFFPQRRGFMRFPLKAGACDVVMGVPAALQMLRATAPYYRSTYVFVTRREMGVIRSFTANAFSTDEVPLSTARLYTLSQPGHSLWGIAAGNPINPGCVTPPTADKVEPRVCGGTIAFGGGVPLYKGNRRVGGLGVSGDTPCTDHEIAKRMRDDTGLNPKKGPYADDIQYTSADGPSIYAHPLCPNT